VTQASRKQKEGKPISDHVITNVREVLVFASLIVAVYLFIALLTYHPDDPGWSHSVTVNAIHNSAGTVGAWIADIMLYIFGYFGYVIPLIVFDQWLAIVSIASQERTFQPTTIIYSRNWNPAWFNRRMWNCLDALLCRWSLTT